MNKDKVTKIKACISFYSYFVIYINSDQVIFEHRVLSSTFAQSLPDSEHFPQHPHYLLRTISSLLNKFHRQNAKILSGKVSEEFTLLHE